ncbi:MAG: PAS domain-containing protein [Alphaproteobacteria bacterium]|nr:PAS domain-containing protein [Alphaproteobacteria bacterium]
MFTKKENSEDISPQNLFSSVLEAGFFEWNIQKDEVILSSYFSEKLSFKTIYTIQHYHEWISLIHPDDVQYFKYSFEKALTKEKPYITFECRQLGRDQKWHWFNIWGKAIGFSSEDIPVHVAGTCVDITKYREDMINASQTQLLISEINHIKNSKKDNNSLLPICTEVLKSFNKLVKSSNSILLLSPSENLRNGIKNHLPTSSIDNKNLNSKEWSEEKNEFIKNFPITKNNLIQNTEKTSLLGIHLELPFDSQGMLITERTEPFSEELLEFIAPLVETINNVISLKKHEEKSRELDSIIEFFIKQVPVPVAMFDAEMRHKFVSEAWKRDNELGEEHEFINKYYYDIYPEEAAIWKKNYQRVLNGETITWKGTKDINKYGKAYWTEGTMVPWYTLDGTLGGLFMYCNNITNRIEQENVLRRTLEDLNKANQALKKSNESLESFAYVCSHDLKEPLRRIESYIQLLFNKQAQHFDEDSTLYMNYARKGINQMKTLIHDILQYSKVIGQTKQEKVLVALNNTVEEIKKNFSYQLEEINGQIKIAHLPTIKAEPVQIDQLFMNLIGNAIKFRSKKPLIVEIFAIENDSFWEIHVKDNGIGIDKEYHQSVFEAFKRLNSRHIYEEGSGVGLSICQKIVERHEGIISIQSNPEGGCDFIIKIPK